MNLEELSGAVLVPLCRAAAAGEGRDALYPALLTEPLLLGLLSPAAAPGPTRVIHASTPSRLVEAPALKAPVLPLYLSVAALRADAADRGYWPDGVEQAEVLAGGAAFPPLARQPGALLVGGDGLTLPLDAGEVAALGEGLTPPAFLEALRDLSARGRGRDVARRLAARMLYVLGHPDGGLLLFSGEVPAFVHLASAERFAARLSSQSGTRSQHGLVLGSELFQKAQRGRLKILVEPGPGSFSLRAADLR